MKISLAMIVRNAEDTIIPCLLSVKDYVDEVVIVDTASTDGTKDAIRSVCPEATILDWDDPNKHPTEGWISNFSIPRNMSFDACTGDVILWLDADDVVANKDSHADPGARLRSMIETFMWHKEPAGDVIEMRYAYKKDEFGNTLLDLPRYRVVRRGFFEWVYPVHEDLSPKQFVKHVDWQGGDEFIDHRKRETEDAPSAKRNLWIMQNWIADGGEMNGRLWGNVAGSHVAMAEWAEAIEAYDKAIELHADDHEARYVCYMRSAHAAQKMEDWAEASRRMQLCSGCFPTRKHPYVALAEIAMDSGDPEQALMYCDVAERMPGDSEGFVQHTTSLDAVPLYTRARAYLELGDHDQSLQAYRMLQKDFPGAPEIEGALRALGEIQERQGLYNAVLAVSSKLPEAKAAEMMRALPETYRTLPAIARATKPPVPSDRPHLVLYCGRTLDSWGPSSLEKGIGGSEEAVILVSRELVALGWHVEVYAFPPAKEQGWDEQGVVWLPYSAWEVGDTCDVFLGWRQHVPQGAFRCDLASGAKQRWLWLHDTIAPVLFSADWIEQLDGIFCLSKSHAEWMPDEFMPKVKYTANGLDPEFFADGPNESHRFIYASSPDRGLETLLQEWPAIKEAIPEAVLDVYYGFNDHYRASMAHSPELRRLKDSIEALAKADGVVWHGMVDQRELAQAFARAGFWLYPTGWHETSCITGMKAQAMGAIPITSRFPRSSLPETCKYDLGPEPGEGIIYGDPEWRARWVAAVIESAGRTDLDAYRQEMKAWAREEFSWQKVAKGWDGLFRAKCSETSQSRPKPLLVV